MESYFKDIKKMVIKNKISLFSLLIFLPLFISFSSSFDIIFNKRGGFGQHGYLYLFTMPISFVLLTTLFFKKGLIKWFINNKNCFYYLFFLLYCLILLIFGKLYNSHFSSSVIRVSFLLILFLYLIEIFQWKFYLIFLKNENKNKIYLENKYVIYPLTFILFSSVVSSILIFKDAFIFTDLVIYNYDQYFGFIFVILSGIVIQSNASIFLKILIYVLSFMVCHWGANFTAILLLLVLFIWNIVSLGKIKNSLYIFISILLVFCVPIYYILIYQLYEPGMFVSNFETRATSMILFFNGLEISHLFFPFMRGTRGFFVDAHSQFLEIFMSLGLIGLIFFYGVILLKLRKIGARFPDVGFSLMIVIFVGGLVVNTTMHPYLIVSVAYILAFYYKLSSSVKE